MPNRNAILEYVTLVKPTLTTGAGGRVTNTGSVTVASNLSAEITHISSWQTWTTLRTQAGTTHVLRTRKPIQDSDGDEVTPTKDMWFTLDGRTLHINGKPQNIRERGWWWQIECREKE